MKDSPGVVSELEVPARSAPGTHDGPWASDDVRMFRASIREFIHNEFVPRQPAWRAEHRPDADAWARAGLVGMLLPDVPGHFGGGGATFAHECVVIEELARAVIPFGSAVHSTVAHYILSYGDDDQKRRWLPRMAAGDLVGAIAMTEPGAGSDLQGIRTIACRDGDTYVVNGSKTFITNGAQAGLVCMAVKTDPKAAGMRALSLLAFETRGLSGYSVGTPLEKVGMLGQDTCELFFSGVRVPASSLLGGTEGRGLAQMMERLGYERLSIAVAAIASAEQALAITARYARDRSVSGKPLMDLQNTRFRLAECAADVRVGRAFIDQCVERFLAGSLDATSTAIAKYWMTEMQCRVIDECVQLHGGYGYMAEYPIARMWTDSRVQRIYGGTNEIMKELIACSI